jgi:predicted metal-dependent hydrolase
MHIEINKLIRSKRRTISLEITEDGTLIVRAPLKISTAVIEKFAYQKRFWIAEKQKILKERFLKITPKRFVDGEEFMYLGKIFCLKIFDGKFISLTANNALHFPRDLLPKAKQALVSWYKEQALQNITERVQHYARLANLKYRSIKITSAESRWGSCGARGSLNFSWRLIMAPQEVIDYVVVHEVAHLAVKNHSRRFWHKVQEIMPDYKQRKHWLRKNSHLFVM